MINKYEENKENFIIYCKLQRAVAAIENALYHRNKDINKSFNILEKVYKEISEFK